MFHSVWYADLRRKIIADKMDVFINSPTLYNSLLDDAHESSVLLLNSCVFALKKALKDVGEFKGPIGH